MPSDVTRLFNHTMSFNSLFDTFDTGFSADGVPLDEEAIIPIGRVVRGALWSDSLAPKFLARMDADNDGKVNMLDFVAFFHSKLADADDETFDSVIQALKIAANPAEVVDNGDDGNHAENSKPGLIIDHLTAMAKRNPLICGGVVAFYTIALASFGTHWLLYTILVSICVATSPSYNLMAPELLVATVIVNFSISLFLFGFVATATTAATASGAWFGADRFKQEEGSGEIADTEAEKKERTRSKKGGKKKGKVSNKAKITDVPKQGRADSVETDISNTNATEVEEQEEMFWEDEDEDEEEDQSDDDYDLAMMLGGNKGHSKVKSAGKGHRRLATSRAVSRADDERFRHQTVPDDGYDHQDWGNVVWGSRNINATAPKARAAKSAQELNAAMRSGNFEAVKKVKLGGPSNFHLLDNADEAIKLQTVSLQLSKRIQQARAARGMKQAQLAKMINEKPVVVNEYETGSAVPSNAVLGKLEKALGVKLRGKY